MPPFQWQSIYTEFYLICGTTYKWVSLLPEFDFLSRLPTKQVQIKEEEEVLDINDNNYEINVIDSSALKPVAI
jgi:hypothetical protein